MRSNNDAVRALIKRPCERKWNKTALRVFIIVYCIVYTAFVYSMPPKLKGYILTGHTVWLITACFNYWLGALMLKGLWHRTSQYQELSCPESSRGNTQPLFLDIGMGKMCYWSLNALEISKKTNPIRHFHRENKTNTTNVLIRYVLYQSWSLIHFKSQNPWNQLSNDVPS